MRHAIILPTKLINSLGGHSDFILALSHLLNDDCDNEYAIEIMKSGKEIVLDNGLYENHVPEGAQSLRRKAIKIGAKSVFAPDHLFDCKKTRKELFSFIEVGELIQREYGIADEDMPECNYVIQANSSKEYLAEFEKAQSYPINMIGLSILAIPNSFKDITGVGFISLNRAIAISMLDQIAKKFDNPKDCHLLGLGESLIDVVIAKNMSRCVSNDSCVAFWSVIMNGSGWSSDGVLIDGKPKTKLDFERDKDLSLEEFEDILRNIEILKKI